jgi:hypothetical protein
MVGKKREKFIDEELGAKSGYKVYKVSSIDQTRNRVYLEGLNVSPQEQFIVQESQS